MIRPGPYRLAPGLAPGGYVIHVYAVPSGALLWAGTVGPSLGDVERAAAEAARAAALETTTCHVAYDGDTGVRLAALEWLEIRS